MRRSVSRAGPVKIMFNKGSGDYVRQVSCAGLISFRLHYLLPTCETDPPRGMPQSNRRALDPNGQSTCCQHP